MKIRRKRDKDGEVTYWPSFVDIMAIVCLTFFFLMILAMGLLTVFVDNISSKRADLYNSIEQKLEQNHVDENVIKFDRDKGKIEILTETFFDRDSYDLKQDGKDTAKMMGSIFQELLSDKEIAPQIEYIEVVGHTDFLGTTTYDRTLSANRAVSFLNQMVPENSELENSYGEKFKASGMSKFENYATKAERDRTIDDYNVEETSKDRRIEIRMVFNNTDLEQAISQRLKALNNK